MNKCKKYVVAILMVCSLSSAQLMPMAVVRAVPNLIGKISSAADIIPPVRFAKSLIRSTAHYVMHPSDLGNVRIACNEIPVGFGIGYVTGLVPVLGQLICPILLAFGTDDPHTNGDLLFASGAVGHVAGVATVGTAAYCAYKGAAYLLKRLLQH